jgi:hypothetical protein
MTNLVSWTSLIYCYWSRNKCPLGKESDSHGGWYEDDCLLQCRAVVALMAAVAIASEMSVNVNQTTRCNILEDSHHPIASLVWIPGYNLGLGLRSETGSEEQTKPRQETTRRKHEQISVAWERKRSLYIIQNYIHRFKQRRISHLGVGGGAGTVPVSDDFLHHVCPQKFPTLQSTKRRFVAKNKLQGYMPHLSLSLSFPFSAS